MRLSLYFYGVLFVVTWMKGFLASLEHHVDWITASNDCNAKYDSQLIPQSYIEDQNLHSDVIQGIGVNVSAWVDGKIQQIGCDQVKCLWIQRLNEHQNRKMPFICVISADMNVNLTEVSYKESTELCSSPKIRIEDHLQKYAMISMLNKFLQLPTPRTTFWLPNVELSDSQDTSCNYVVSRDNRTVETKSDNCSIPRMGVCINTTYISEYQMSVMLEITVEQFPVTKGSGISWTVKEDKIGTYGSKEKLHVMSARADKDAGIQDVSVSVALSATSLFLVVLFTCISIFLWKRLSSKLNLIMKENQRRGSENETESRSKKKKIKKKAHMYEVLPQNTHGHSTRVKALPMEKENPYSEIACRRESGFQSCSNSGTSGQTEETI